MEPVPSFAPLAARLAAHSAALRPAQGGRDGLGAAVMATVWRLLLEYLIYVCERLDARAAADAAGAMAAPAPNAIKVAVIPAPRAARQAVPGDIRAPRRLAVTPEAQATAPSLGDAPPAAARATPARPQLAWSRDPASIRAALAVPWRPHRETGLSHQRPCTPILLRYRN